jgi:hypothetical protein
MFSSLYFFDLLKTLDVVCHDTNSQDQITISFFETLALLNGMDCAQGLGMMASLT